VRLFAIPAALVVLFATWVRADTAEVAEPLPAPVDVRSAEARKAVSACSSALKTARKHKSREERLSSERDALRDLVAARSARVAQQLAALAADDRLLAPTRVLALRALPLQGEHGAEVADRVARWLADESEQEADARREGDIGVPVDRRSGEPVVDTPEAEAALRAGAERARLLAAGIRTLRELEHEPRAPDEVLRPLLQSPFDDLAVAAVEAAQAWDARGVADELALLLRMYPRENRWETGAVTHLNGTNASAKAAWMALFGHPMKQRPRPELYRALLACASAWAGREMTDSASCANWLASLEG
jgi:hypothetical protein